MPILRHLTRPLLLLAAAALMLAAPGIPADGPARAASKPNAKVKLDVDYEPTSQRVVETMLAMARVTAADYVIDLGCGDGRIPVTAARKLGARGLCVDLDPRRIKEARANIDKHKVADKVTLVEGDLFKTDLSEATVVTLFLWPTLNLKLRPKLLDLKPGTRVVSNEHDMGDWPPDGKQRFGGIDTPAVFLWIIPAKVSGDWILKRGNDEMVLSITQRYQRLTGTALVGGKQRALRNGRVNGREVSFDLVLSGTTATQFSGALAADGTLSGAGWTAGRKK